MAYSYLKETNLSKLWKSSKDYTDKLTDPLPEFARLGDNKPSDNVDPDFPDVTDGTAASIKQKTPKRVVQQLPDGDITSDNPGWLNIVADNILENEIIPHANSSHPLLQKCRLALEDGIALGFALGIVKFTHSMGRFTTDVSLIHWGDIGIQEGAKSAADSKYLFIREWWTKEDVESLIEEESKRVAESDKRLKLYKKEAAAAEEFNTQNAEAIAAGQIQPVNPEKPETYEPTWDIAALKGVKDALTSKDETGKTTAEDDRGTNGEFIQFVTGYQDGIGATIYTFNPDKKKVLRRKKNDDPRGVKPLAWLFGDVSNGNPLGRSIMELIGPLQNLIDSDMQAYQYERWLNMQPTLLNYGGVEDVFIAPRNVINIDNPNAKIEPLRASTTAIEHYPELYQLQQSQLYNLAQSSATNIPSDAGAITQGKTPAAIKSQQMTLSTDDNAWRKQFETWYEEICGHLVNVYFTSMHGTRSFKLDDRTVERLMQTEGFDKSRLEENNLVINFDQQFLPFYYTVTASSSRKASEQEQIQSLELVQKFIDGSPAISEIVDPVTRANIYNQLISVSGVEDTNLLRIDTDKLKEQLDQQSKGQLDPTAKELIDALSMKFEQLPSDIQAMLIQKTIGIQPQQPTPSAIKSMTDVHDSETRAIQAQANAIRDVDAAADNADESQQVLRQAEVDMTQQLRREFQQMGYTDEQIDQAIEINNRRQQSLAGVSNG